MSTSPIPEASSDLTQNTETITELFARDPITWSDEDMEKMIAHYRKLRINLDAQPEGTKKKAAAKEKVPVEDLKGLSGAELLGKLGLE
jgi:hypothetical protein